MLGYNVADHNLSAPNNFINNCEAAYSGIQSHLLED